MKTYVISCLLLIATVGTAGADDLVKQLDRAWNRHDYSGCRKLIQEALQKNPSNLTARVALAAYHGWVEFDLVAATNAMPQSVAGEKGKTGKLAAEVVDIWRAALTVPMNSSPPEKDKELVRRDLWPTNYPEHELLIQVQSNENEMVRTSKPTVP